MSKLMRPLCRIGLPAASFFLLKGLVWLGIACFAWKL
jgi:hypothetical protein